MGEISILGRLVGVCKHDTQAASLYFLFTELDPVSETLFPSNIHGNPLKSHFALIWIYPDDFVLFSPVFRESYSSGLPVCPM